MQTLCLQAACYVPLVFVTGCSTEHHQYVHLLSAACLSTGWKHQEVGLGREAAVRLFGADFAATTEFLGGTAEEHSFTERKKC